MLTQLEFRAFQCLLVWNFVFDPIEGKLVSQINTDKLMRIQKRCFLKLTVVS
jgi:hypothetical protein